MTFTFSRETEDLDAWQGDKIRVLTTREPATVGFRSHADQFGRDRAGDGRRDRSRGVHGHLQVTFPPEATTRCGPSSWSLSDEGTDLPLCRSRDAQVEGDVTYTLTRAGAVTYPLTFGLLENDPKYIILSDDTAMGRRARSPAPSAVAAVERLSARSRPPAPAVQGDQLDMGRFRRRQGLHLRWDRLGGHHPNPHPGSRGGRYRLR